MALLAGTRGEDGLIRTGTQKGLLSLSFFFFLKWQPMRWLDEIVITWWMVRRIDCGTCENTSWNNCLCKGGGGGGALYSYGACSRVVCFNGVSINIWTRGQKDVFHCAILQKKKKKGAKIIKFLPSLNIFPALFFPAEDWWVKFTPLQPSKSLTCLTFTILSAAIRSANGFQTRLIGPEFLCSPHRPTDRPVQETVTNRHWKMFVCLIVLISIGSCNGLPCTELRSATTSWFM